MKSDITFLNSRKIEDYKEILQGLYDDFEYEHWPYILTWCGIIDPSEDDIGKYWEVWIIEVKERKVGICGVYSLKRYNNRELWIGWFGVLPEYRGNQIGETALSFMEAEAKKRGCQLLLSYIEPGEYPLKFYNKHGFGLSGTVELYGNEHPELLPYMGEKTDLVIYKRLDL